MANYINNATFLEKMVAYREKVQKARAEGKPDPIIPDYIGLCFMQICERLSMNRNFIAYTYRDEMIADAIENCIIAVHNFDPEKSKNPFGYFTQIAWFAFLRRIAKEKKQSYIKYKQFQNMNIMGSLVDGGDDVPGFSMNVDNDFIDEAVRSFEETKKKKDAKVKAKKAKKGLESFMEDDEGEKFIDEDTLKENKFDAEELESEEMELDEETRRTLGLQQTGTTAMDIGIKPSTGKKIPNGRQFRGD